MLCHYSKLISIRHKHPAIARGEYNAVTSENNNFGGFYIEYDNQTVFVFHNTSTEKITIDVTELEGLDTWNANAEVADFIGAGKAKLDGCMLTVDGMTSVIIQ